MKKNKFSKGKLIFSEGAVGDDAYRILSGSVEISTQQDGQKLVLATLGAGEIFGEMAMIDNRPRSASARVIDPIEVEVIQREDFSSMLEGGSEQMLPLLRTIFDRLRITNDRLSLALDQLNELEPSKTRRHHESFGREQASLCIRLDPDSEEMSNQRVMKGQVIRHFPFLFGRRGNIVGGDGSINNQLLVADRSPYRVSRKHCFLQMRADTIFVEDTMSRLGTIVNGVSIGGESLESRAKLSLGENTLILGGLDSQVRFKLWVEGS